MPNETIVPAVYKYLIMDLVTGAFVMEVPFSGVSFERRVVTCGSFSGRIAMPGSAFSSEIRVTTVEDHFDLYNSTMPGKHALYVMRDGVCVWSGIIWSRDYDIVSRELNVSALEFQSYFYNRVFWKSFYTDQYQTTNNALDADTIREFLTYLVQAVITDTDKDSVPGITSSDPYAYQASDVHNRISTFYRSGLTTGVYTTTAPHGFIGGETIHIGGLNAIGYTGLDGPQTVLSVVDATTFTCTTASQGSVVPATAVTVLSSAETYVILSSIRANLLAAANPNITIDINTDLDGYITEGFGDNNPFLYRGSELNYVGEILENLAKNGVQARALNLNAVMTSVSPAGTTRYVINKQLTTGTCTLTTYKAHGLTTGNTVTITGVGADFNATGVAITVVDAVTFQYTSPTPTPADVASTSLLGPTRAVRFDYYMEAQYSITTGTFSNVFKAWLVRFDVNDPRTLNSSVSPALETLYGPSNLGANNLVFEHPGNISRFTIAESAEHAAVRLWVHDTSSDSGATAAPRYGSYTNVNYLYDTTTQSGWPLLDMARTDVKLYTNSDEEIAPYAKAMGYRVSPPMATINVSVNGSLDPKVGTYKPGDWCVVIPNDPFVNKRLMPPYENRSSLLVRKIESFKVDVPDNPAFPETVDLKLVAEWEVA